MTTVCQQYFTIFKFITENSKKFLSNWLLFKIACEEVSIKTKGL